MAKRKKKSHKDTKKELFFHLTHTNICNHMQLWAEYLTVDLFFYLIALEHLILRYRVGLYCSETAEKVSIFLTNLLCSCVGK